MLKFESSITFEEENQLFTFVEFSVAMPQISKVCP